MMNRGVLNNSFVFGFMVSEAMFAQPWTHSSPTNSCTSLHIERLSLLKCVYSEAQPRFRQQTIKKILINAKKKYKKTDAK